MSRTRNFLTLLFILISLANTLPAIAQSKKQIPLTQLEAMFENMRAKTKWDVDGPLLWGYFFYDPDSEKLVSAARDLEAMGYLSKGVMKVPNKQDFRLHVEKIETHTPKSLNERNLEFYSFAEKNSIQSYDGMDVGPVPLSAK
jgi:Regulator of ribonuclease activity B